MSNKDKETKETTEEIKKEKVDTASEEQVEEKDSEKEETPEKEEPTELEKAKMEYDQLNNKYLRLYSEFENFRKRTIKEKSDLILNGSRDVMSELLSVLDDFDRAIINNKEVEDAKFIKEGMELIHKKMNKVLSEKGLKEMECKGKEFDSELHEAVANFPVEKKKQKGKIIDVTEKGYYLNDKVIRHAKVVVGQ